jgi:hypothetical protein
MIATHGPAWHAAESIAPLSVAQQSCVPVQSDFPVQAGGPLSGVPLLLPLPLLELLELLLLVLPSSPASAVGVVVAGVLLELHATAAIAAREPERATKIIFLFIFSEPPQSIEGWQIASGSTRVFVSCPSRLRKSQRKLKLPMFCRDFPVAVRTR